MYDDAGDFDVHAFIQSNGEVTHAHEPEQSEDSTESSDDLILSEVVAWINLYVVNDLGALWTDFNSSQFIAEFPIWGPELRREVWNVVNHLSKKVTTESCQRFISDTLGRFTLQNGSVGILYLSQEKKIILDELRRLHSKFKITEYLWSRKQRLANASGGGECWHSIKWS
jgi:hypothetical protein